MQQAHAGDSWKLNSGHTQKMKYEANSANEVLKFVTNTNWVNGATTSAISLATDPNSENGHFKTAQLYKTTVTDEDGNPVIQFTNGRGQVLLIRKTDGAQNIDTYYVYNEYNQKAFVIPPKAIKQIKDNGNTVTQAILDDLCYHYSYDGQDRQVERKLPGKGKEYFVFDKADRLILHQDSVLKSQGKWLINKYDQFGRVVYTGIINGGDRAGLQNQLNNLTIRESRSTSGFNKNGLTIYYTNDYFTSDINTVLTVNYYDTYPTEAPAIPTTVLGQYTLPQALGTNDTASTKSLQTASYVKNIEDNNWTKMYNYYDTRGRIVATKSINHLAGYTNKDLKLDFTGLIEESYTYHKRTASDTEIKVKERFVYDNQNRLVKQYHQVDNLQEELLAENNYNEIGQLINKKTGNNTGTPLQSIDYAYNIRGWMTSVNNPNNPSSFNGKLFGLELKYDNPVNTSTYTVPKYNGNIAELDWKTANGNILRRYAYKYDKLDRMTDASYLEPLSTVPVTNGYSEFLTYDTNGNIQTLKRYQSYNNTAMMIDDLVYSNYKGNQLINVTDNSNNTLGYSAGGNTIDYDLNGNMINHIDKGIESISYNFLNLPNNVLFQQGGLTFSNNLAFLYRADGVKLNKAHTYLNPRSGVMLTENTEYLDGFQYVGQSGFNNLQFFPTSEGYYDFQKKRYVYNYTDQVGNIRLAYYRDANNTAVIDKETNYYPFGMEYQGYNGTYTQNQNYRYGFQGQERQQETGWNSFKWRNSIPELGRFFNIDPLSEKYTYNSTYAFQENKIGMGVELEGLELLKNHTGFFAINGNSMKVKLAPISQRDSNGHPTFTAGDIGLTTSGYNPNGARITTGTTGLRLDSYKYSGPVPDAVQMQNTRDKISTKVRQSFKTTKTGAEMWNIKQYRADQASAASSGIKEIVKLAKLGANIPDAIKSTNDYVQAVNDITAVKSQAVTMDQAIKYVDGSGIEMNQQTRNDVVNYVFDGTLPNPDAGLMPNSLIIQNGAEIMRTNGIPIQPLDEQLTTKSREIPQ